MLICSLLEKKITVLFGNVYFCFSGFSNFPKDVSFCSESKRNCFLVCFSLLHLLNCSNGIPSKNIPKFFDIETGCLNNDETLQAIQSFSPTKIIIFGTSLLDSKYLKLYPNRIFNLHVGLSQHYRGSSCNFWPIHELRPDLLGATIHYVEKGIDNGEIKPSG